MGPWGEGYGTGMAEEEAAPVREGEILAGKYRVERVLGVGGMGVVVAATHLQLDQRVALKFLLPRALANAEVVARFAREARAAAKIQSEHVARVIDVGTMPETGSPYMVMEYLEGKDLAETLHIKGVLPVDETVGYLLQACEALAEAHAAGIVHRDLKPANLFLARRPGRGDMVKVLDFGISKVTTTSTSDDAALTKTATLMGSPLYMSPEQLMSAKSVDARSDIWAVGVILYELLSGEPPFSGDTVPEIVTRILHVANPSLCSKRPEIPSGLDEVVSRCLSKDPGSRYANVAELAHALAPFASARTASTSVERISRVLGQTSIRPPTDSGAAIAPSRNTAQAMTDGSWSESNAGIPKRGSSLGLVAGLVVGVAALGLGAWLLLFRAQPTTVPPANANGSNSTLAPAPRESHQDDPPSPTSLSPSLSVDTKPTPTPSVAIAPIAPTVKRPVPGTTTTPVGPKTSAAVLPAPSPAPTMPPPPPPVPTKKNPLDMVPQ
jgi:serine/threonine protein kinase